MKNAEIIAKLNLEQKCALLSGAGTFTTRGCPKAGVPSITLSDGPNGVRKQAGTADHLGLNPSVPATCFPTAATVACSWDPALGEQLGQAMGEEAAAQEVAVLLGPGLNTKRSPLCGRNFEYFSEDPLLSGRMAAAMTAGVQSVPGRGTTVKHFACNNRENDRVELNSIVSERALRELYLKGFEIALRSPTPPAAVMTAYNLVNGVHAANSYALCTVLAREEWGYRGVLMTDWDSTGSRRCTAVGCMLAGNELLMPGCQRDYDELLDAVRAGKLPRAALQQCAARVIAAARQLQR